MRRTYNILTPQSYLAHVAWYAYQSGYQGGKIDPLLTLAETLD